MNSVKKQQLELIQGKQQLELIQGKQQLELIQGKQQLELIQGKQQLELIPGKQQLELIPGKQQLELIQGKQQLELIPGKQQLELIHGKQQLELIPGKQQLELIPGKQQFTLMQGKQHLYRGKKRNDTVVLVKIFAMKWRKCLQEKHLHNSAHFLAVSAVFETAAVFFIKFEEPKGLQSLLKIHQHKGRGEGKTLLSDIGSVCIDKGDSLHFG